MKNNNENTWMLTFLLGIFYLVIAFSLPVILYLTHTLYALWAAFIDWYVQNECRYFVNYMYLQCDSIWGVLNCTRWWIILAICGINSWQAVNTYQVWSFAFYSSLPGTVLFSDFFNMLMLCACCFDAIINVYSTSYNKLKIIWAFIK